MQYGRKMGKDKLLVIGGGSWGTAFANYLASSKDPSRREVKIWVREKEVIDAIRSTHENPVLLNGIKLSRWLKPVHKLKREAAAADILIVAVPSKFIRNMLKALRGNIKNKKIINLSKGFESTSLKTISPFLYSLDFALAFGNAGVKACAGDAIIM